jgi:exopolysaccharide production protein ExoY
VLVFALLSPLLAIVAGVITLLSGRTPLIAHRRVGWRGATLWMLKFRSMWGNSVGRSGRVSGLVEYIEDESGPKKKQEDDPRVVNWFARRCRRHSIDELPQLWHVIRGEMALVGPRPLTAAEVRQHYGVDAGEMLSLKPGIAGLWQSLGRNRLSYERRRELDLEFVRKRSVRMYMRIVMRTIPEVLTGANTW